MVAIDQCCVLVTGASGLLGRAILTTFGNNGGWKKVVGTAYSRAGENLVKVDLLDIPAVEKFIADVRPGILIHSAAQRFPDKMEKDLEQARKLNVETTRALAKSMNQVNGKMLYISTDYVFDGQKPPYKHDSEANPLNEYGRSKLDGERVVLKENKDNVVLRIPILYGDVEYLDESAITTLFKKLTDSTSEVEMSDYEIRRPSHVKDIANIVHQLATLSCTLKEEEKPSGIFQWCGQEPMTKYKMVLEMAAAFSLDTNHVLAVKGPSPGSPRPYDTTMDTGRLVDLGIGVHTPFRQGIKQVLEKWAK